jgi:acyl-coenzyme A synthetase/AMP-(fatty) acid ligase
VDVGGIDTSYILHTSGSTGEPKLIRHTHASALAFIEWAVDEYGICADDRLSNHSSHHTCFATFDFYAAARAAASTVILTPASMLMPASLAQLVERERITVWYSVPTALVQLLLRGDLDHRDFSALRWVLFAGETFPEKHLRGLMQQLPNARFSHVYGSTEVNVCTFFHLSTDGDVPIPLPIGRPCSNAESLVVDDALDPVPDGGTGELLIKGSTVMSGYWGDPVRNRHALVRRRAPGGFDDIYFRTGDRVRTLDDGNLTFAGRADLQVKVRGYRVELEEVENALLGLEPVHEAAAFSVSDGEGSLTIRAAVVVDPEAEGTHKSLLDGLKKKLPLYAVPSELEILTSLPRTPTGKVDRKKLVASLADRGDPHA